MTDQEEYSGGGEKTVAKLVMLEKYIGAYLSIMSKPHNWQGSIWYVDTHAGTGFSNEFETLIPGSTLRALDCDFDRFYFYEKDAGRFARLCSNIEAKVGVDLWRINAPESGPPRAGCNEPEINVMNGDSNKDVAWLIEKAGASSHWFTFVDPERMSVTLELMEKLRDRGSMDILLNFQTDAYHRNVAEGATQSHQKVDQSLPRGWPIDASPDELVQHYTDEVFESHGWLTQSETMISEGSNPWRYDLIFASENETAVGIMADIMSKSVKNDILEEINRYRDDSEGQLGIDSFTVKSLNDEENKGRDSSLFDF